jgi:hypothetical protein
MAQSSIDSAKKKLKQKSKHKHDIKQRPVVPPAVESTVPHKKTTEMQIVSPVVESNRKEQQHRTQGDITVITITGEPLNM